MGSLPDFFSRKITSLSPLNLFEASRIKHSCFANHTQLKSIVIPESVKVIENSAFSDCTSLYNIDTDNMDPYCEINCNFEDTTWYNSQPNESIITMANGRIMVGNKISKPSNGFVIPSNIVTLGTHACRAIDSDNADSSFTSFIIPDTVEIICESIFYLQSGLTQITIGKNVRKIGSELVPTNATTLIFRQPADMEIELPTPGENTGLGYEKNSRSLTIYTDNIAIRNYDWSADNATVTFYPLSEAP